MAGVTGRSLLERVASSPINYWGAMVTDAFAATAFACLGAVWYAGPLYAAPLLIVAGFLGWTFFEYVLHRWLLHGIFNAPRREHARHHGHPRAPISTPVLTVTLGAIALWALATLVLSRGGAALLVFGTYAGYNYFALVHHLQHHYPSVLARSPWFGHQLRMHELHHRHPELLFGISSSLWDRVFGTFLEDDEVVVENPRR
jgi:sterol desaturase/sphingolipid hydroxylase (fatty acid hydroxylase superfamily)